MLCPPSLSLRTIYGASHLDHSTPQPPSSTLYLPVLPFIHKHLKGNQHTYFTWLLYSVRCCIVARYGYQCHYENSFFQAKRNASKGSCVPAKKVFGGCSQQDLCVLGKIFWRMAPEQCARKIGDLAPVWHQAQGKGGIP